MMTSIPAAVQLADERLELGHLRSRRPRAVARLRREEGDRVVAPVVDEAVRLELRAAERLLHRQELHGVDAEGGEPGDLLDEPEIGAGPAHLRRRVGGEALDVDLVDHEVFVRDARGAVAAPVERRVDHDRARSARRAVPPVAHEVAVPRVVPAQQALLVVGPAREGARVRVDEELGVVEAVSMRRGPTARRRGSRTSCPRRRRPRTRGARPRCAPCGPVRRAPGPPRRTERGARPSAWREKSAKLTPPGTTVAPGVRAGLRAGNPRRG